MRLLILFFSVFLVGSLGFSGPTKIPRDLLYKYIQQQANFSADPCDDFYDHVCPPSVRSKPKEWRFVDFVEKEFEDVVTSVKDQYYDGDLRDEQNDKFAKTLWKFLDTEKARDFCIDHKDQFSKITRIIINETLTDGNTPDWETIPCYIQFQLIKKADQKYYKDIRFILVNAIRSTIARLAMGNTGETARNFFENLRNETREAFKKTPWANNKKVVEKFIAVLDAIKFHRAQEYEGNILRGVKELRKSQRECRKTLAVRASYHVSEVLCDTISISDGWKAADFPKQWYDFNYTMGHQMALAVLSDRIPGGNGFDRFVTIGNIMDLLMVTNHSSLLYGGAGLTLGHEFMHTFVFDEKDGDFSNLKSYWTNSSDCIKEQAAKTCKTFPFINCVDTSLTFEEDASDMAALHIIWNSYLKSLSPEEMKNDEEKKLFFYGFPTFFCRHWPEGYSNTHSSEKHRTNSMASQSEAFQELFKCKSTDRMVMNKAKKCVLYGEEAPENKRLWIDEDHVAAFG